MFYEFSAWGCNERVIAVYDGLFYKYGDAAALMKNTGILENNSIVDQLKFDLQWRYWIKNPNIKFSDLTKITAAEVRHNKVDYNDSEYNIYKLNYILENDFYELEIFIKSGANFIFRIDTYINGEYHSSNLFGEPSDTKSFETFTLKQNGININYQKQFTAANREYYVYYYDANSSDIKLNFSSLTSVGTITRIRLSQLTSTNLSDANIQWTSSGVSTSGTMIFDISNKVSSGYYILHYLLSNGSWEQMDSVILIPESSFQGTLSGTGKTLKIKYLKQFFNTQTEETNYLNEIVTNFNTELNNYISEGWVTNSQLYDNTVDLWLVPPEGKNYFTFYEKNMSGSLAKTAFNNGSYNVSFYFRAGYQNTVSENGYSSSSIVAKLSIAHEILHWIIFSKNPKTSINTAQNNNLTWVQEGLCAMSDVYWNPSIELRNNSKFANRSKELLSALKTQPIFYYSDTTLMFDPYQRCLFFYFIKEKYGISAIKTLINNIDTYFFTGNNFVANGNAFENAVKNWLNSATGNQSDSLIADFYSILLKKDFLKPQISTLYDNLPYQLRSDVATEPYFPMNLSFGLAWHFKTNNNSKK
jgi:hypothetical protein